MPEEKPQNLPPAGGAPNFNKLELDILKFWEDNHIFEKSLEQTKDKEPYIFYDGPPFATGLPHYGSILPSVIKDAIPRYQTMKGRFVRRRWGWDCHGLPIENIVEQQLKISGKKQIEELGVDKFNETCRQSVLRYADEWGKTIKRIARWVDFGPPSLWSPSLSKDSGGPSAEALAKADENATADSASINNLTGPRNSYKTMDASYMESVWWGLKQIWDKNLIYEDRKVLLYCSRCETPISNFEVAMDNSYKDVTEESVYAKFKMPKGQRIINDLTNDKTFVLAWTTTPWTLPGNTSLNVGPDIIYVLIESSSAKASEDKQRYILAKDRLSVIDGEYEIVSEFPAHALEGLQYEPLYPGVIKDPKNRAHHIYLADFVTTQDGTGVVHNAAMYGEEDYLLAKEKDLPRVDMLDHKGRYLEMAPESLRGVFFKDAEKIVVKYLQANGLLYRVEPYKHSYPHCYRCGTPLFYNALPAWFVNIQKIKPELLKNNQDISWYPEHLKNGRFKQGVENAPDWNISRNRFWATALPFWKCDAAGCGNVVCIGSIGELAEKSTNFSEIYPAAELGIMNNESGTNNHNSKFIIHNSEIDLHRPYIDRIKLKCDKCQSQMSRIPEVVDCWVESGSMPFAELHAPFENQDLFNNRFPSDFVVEYIPQTRAWFYVMHVISTIIFGKAPFKNVVTTGTILAEDGSKMSKSKNNYPDPNKVIEKYGADALRFYLLTSPVVTGEDLNFSEKGVADIGRKVNSLLYNVWSFYRMYEKDQFLVASSELRVEHVLDKWIVARLNQVQLEVTKQLDVYNTVKAGKSIVDFINDLSTWYLRRSRERLKLQNGESKQVARVLGFVLAETAKLLAPFMPFLADFIYKDVTGKESVHLEQWVNVEGLNIDNQVLDNMEIVREAVTLGLAVRKSKSLPVRQPLLALALELQDAKSELGNEYSQLVLDEMNVKQVDKNLFDRDLRPAEAVVTPGTKAVKTFYLDLNITPELKQEGLARELERAIQDLRKKSGLKVGELADVYYNTQDGNLEDVLLKMFDRKKTFVSQISKSLEVEVDFEAQAEIDGNAVWLGIVKI